MTVQRLLGFALGLAGMASVGLAVPAGAVENPDPGRTYIVDCQGELEYRPKEIAFACGDGGVYIDKIDVVEVEHESGDWSGDLQLKHVRAELRRRERVDLQGAVAVEPAGYGSGEGHVREHRHDFDRHLRRRCRTGDGGLLKVGA